MHLLSVVRRVPTYVWGFCALTGGIVAGGALPELLAPVANGTRKALSFVVLIAPGLVVGALSPAIATLVRRGLAGRFVGAVLLWFVCAAIVGSLLGMVAGGVVFGIPLSARGAHASDGAGLLSELGSGRGVSSAIVAIAAAMAIGLAGVRVDRVYALLQRGERAIARAGASIGVALVPLILALGIMMGVNFGARLGMAHYGLMILYSAALALIWFLLYWLVVLPHLGGVRDRGRLLTEYYLPTALFAAGTCSSLATIPVNVANARRYGVRGEVADFVIPIGAVVHKGASAMQYMAYGPLIAGYVFGIQVGWLQLAVVWPFVVLYTMAAPGVPGAMGLSLWTAVLFASMLGLEDPQRATFVGTWVALAGGIPDMFRTSGNATADGFSAIVFGHHFERRFRGTGAPQGSTAPAPDSRAAGAVPVSVALERGLRDEPAA